jgi:hypothetical protein
MAKKQEAKEVVQVSEIDPEVIGAVVALDLCQLEADGKTHQDKFAANRILFCVDRLRQIAHAELTPELISKMEKIKAILAEEIPKNG